MIHLPMLYKYMVTHIEIYICHADTLKQIIVMDLLFIYLLIHRASFY